MASDFGRAKQHLQRARLACQRVNERLQDIWLIYKDTHPDYASKLAILAGVADELKEAIIKVNEDLNNLPATPEDKLPNPLEEPEPETTDPRSGVF